MFLLSAKISDGGVGVTMRLFCLPQTSLWKRIMCVVLLYAVWTKCHHYELIVYTAKFIFACHFKCLTYRMTSSN